MNDRVPHFRELERDECLEILKRNTLGRIAYRHRERVEIEPTNYVLDGDWIYLRTSRGSKVAALEHSPWVAFEVDEFEALFQWRSVVVHGSVQQVSADVSGVETHEHAIMAMRIIIPETMSPADPVPFRDVILRVHLGEVAGREAEPVS